MTRPTRLAPAFIAIVICLNTTGAFSQKVRRSEDVHARMQEKTKLRLQILCKFSV